MQKEPAVSFNEIEFMQRLEQFDPKVAKIRRMLSLTPQDIEDCLFEVWENMILARQWAEARKSVDQQQVAGSINIRVTRRTINVDKDFHITHPRSVYRRVKGLDIEL